MKKLSIALALILCLVMVIFCFAACGKKKADVTTADPGTTPEATTAPKATEPEATEPEATEPEATEHQHTQGTEYVIDTPATCGAAGSKSYHCTECNQIIPGTEVVIPATGEHQYGEWTTTKEASVLGDGAEERTCTVCSHKEQRSTTFEPTVVTFTDASSDAYNEEKANIREIMGDKHFYPTESDAAGNDLLVEYSILWNDSMLNFVGTAKPYFHTCVGKENGTEEINNIAYWSPVADNSNADCKFAGGFEYGTMRTSEPGNPYPQMTPPVGDSINEFPNIGGFNGGDGIDQGETQWGWHRVQIRLHIDVTNADALKADAAAGATAATYKCITTIYIDGVLVSILSSDTMTNGSVSYDNKLFTAASDGQGGIVYTDVREAEWIHAMRINSTKAKDGTTIYLVYGNVSMTCGKDFVQKVVKVGTPANKTLEVAEGVELDAKVWYREDDGTCTEHVWNGGYEVTKAATLLENGKRTERCSICGESREVDVEFKPDVQKFTDSTKNSYNPNIATLASIRGDEHFYTPGNDLIVEFSILWTEEIKDLKNDKGPYMDSRFTQTSNPDSTNKNIIYWSLSDNCSGSDCKFAGGFEWGGIGLNEPDNPYPKFTKDPTLGTTKDEYPNIGGANGGDGTSQGEDRYGWHRIGIRYREEVANVDAVKAGAAAEYKLSLWVYVDGVLVIHAYDTNMIYKPGKSDERDYKLFTAASDGNGGIAYTDSGDDLYFSGAYLHYKQMASGKVAYFAIADYSATIGSEFVQNVARVNYPVAAELEVEEGVFVPATMWYTKPCAEHTWDGEFTLIEEATLLKDGLKVEHCSVCGMSHEVAVEAAPVITDSKNIAASPYADNQNKDLAILKSVANIRGEDHFYPDSTEIGAQGNDLWFEYSFLYNDSLQYRDATKYLAEMRLFGFRSADYSKYRGFYYIYFLNDDGKGGAFNTSGDCPWAGHIDFSTYDTTYSPGQNCADDLTSLGNTLNGRTIGRYIAGWGAGRNDSPYLWDAEYQTMGGWHRLGFRYHQEVASVTGSTVKYAGYTELYIDGVLCWRVHTNFKADHNDSLTKNGLLLWTATAADGVITGYTDNDTMLVGTRIDRLDTSSQSVYVGIDDPQWNCGDGFVREVVRVENPKPTKITLPDGKDYDGAMYFTYAHSHVWDEDYEVVEAATLLSEGTKIDHCSICGETHESVIDETDPIIISSNMDTAARTAFNTANDVDWLNHPDLSKGIMIKRSINDIKAADQHYYPTEGNAQGNDLLVEVSFLWNETLANTYTWEALTFGHVDGYDVFNVDSKIHPKERDGYTYEFLTPTPAEIAENAALKTPSLGEYGWHRLGFRVHQEAAIDADAVKYTYIASVYVDGVLLVSYDATDYVVRRNPTGTVTALLYTAEIQDGNLVYFDIGDDKAQSTYKTSYGLIFFEDFFKKSNGYCVIGDLSMTCGHDFVQNVEAVADPAAANLTVAEGVEVPAAFYYKLAD